MKASIRQTVWDSWRGYIGGRYVETFGSSSFCDDKDVAEAWLSDRRAEPSITAAEYLHRVKKEEEARLADGPMLIRLPHLKPNI